MLLKIAFLTLATLCACESLLFYSSFWAPLFNPKILGYKVDVEFQADVGKKEMAEYQRKYGYRGSNLIADLGNGKGSQDWTKKEVDTNYEDVQFYYTYTGAYQDNGRI